MRNTYYFLQPSTTFSGLTTIARRIVDAAKATYGNCVMDRLAIDIMVEDLIVSARKAKQLPDKAIDALNHYLDTIKEDKKK